MSGRSIVVVGSVNTDMVVKSRKLPAPGETVTGGRFVLAAGGKGANQAVAAARLGAEVTLVAKVGSDMFGDQAVANFQREGIHTQHVLRDPQQATGVALILVDDAGENLISVAPGANFTITPDEIAQAAAVIRSAALLVLQLEIPMDCVLSAARLAAEAGVRVLLDPAPAAPLGDELLRLVDILKPNETEAEQLTGVAVRDVASAQSAAEKLLAKGVRHVIVTLGPQGSVLVDRDGMRHMAAAKIQAVDTTAAGDAYSGALACGLAHGLTLDEAVRQASLVGAFAATRLGAQPSMPTRAELDAFARSVGEAV